MKLKLVKTETEEVLAEIEIKNINAKEIENLILKNGVKALRFFHRLYLVKLARKRIS